MTDAHVASVTAQSSSQTAGTGEKRLLGKGAGQPRGSLGGEEGQERWLASAGTGLQTSSTLEGGRGRAGRPPRV